MRIELSQRSEKIEELQKQLNAATYPTNLSSNSTTPNVTTNNTNITTTTNTINVITTNTLNNTSTGKFQSVRNYNQVKRENSRSSSPSSPHSRTGSIYSTFML